jgi:hypothetical protein
MSSDDQGLRFNPGISEIQACRADSNLTAVRINRAYQMLPYFTALNYLNWCPNLAYPKAS